MYDEPSEEPAERSLNPADQAKDKCDEFRMHAELVAVFEGVRKYDAEILPNLDRELAREIQRTVAKLEKAKMPETPVIAAEAQDDAAALLNRHKVEHLPTNVYHVHRRPGEVMIVRWLEGEQVDTFYQRMQAHFDAALNAFRQEERQAKEWKQDRATLEYLDALDKLEVKMPDRYLRPIIRQHNLFVLSTQTADEMDIVHLCDYVMGIDPHQLVGGAAAPPEEGATEQDRAWFFKLFSLRGMNDGVETMCFFTFMQKAEDTFGDW